MFVYRCLFLSGFLMMSVALFADTNATPQADINATPQMDVLSYKAEIVKQISKALSENVIISPKATHSSSHSGKKSKCVSSKFIKSKDINPGGFVITEPGVYILECNTIFKPKARSAAIVIDSDNVTLDLGGHTLSQGNSVAGCVGIVVNATSNVNVINGTISDFTLFGVLVNAESSYLTLRQLNVLSNGVDDPSALTVSGGIVATSSLPGAITHDIIIDEVNSSGNFLAGLILSGVTNVDVISSKFNNNVSATTAFGVNAWGVLATAFFLSQTSPSFLPCSNLNFIDSEANENFGLGGTVGIEILSVPSDGFAFNDNVMIQRFTANNNVGGGIPLFVNKGEGIVVAGTGNFVVKDCVACGNASLALAPSGVAGLFASTGFGVPFFGVNGVIENCIAEGNSGSGDISAGFRVLRSSNITVTSCKAIGNSNFSTGEAWGFTTDTNLGNTAEEFGPPVNINFVITDNIAEGNTSAGGLCGGFKFISQVNSTLSNCTSLGNGSPTTPNGFGILVSNPTCCDTDTCCTLDPSVCSGASGCFPIETCCPTSHNVIHNNEVIGNTLFGIFDGAGTAAKNVYYANVARGNGDNYFLPKGTPIRKWHLPHFPKKKDNNHVLDAQLDNISIIP